MINEVMCLVQFDKKTGSKSVIPLFPHALEIATKYEFNLPKRISSQNFNEYIKEICRISGVDSVITLTKLEAERRIPYQIEKWKVVSTHTARRSFITNMSSYGLTDKQISLMSGHKNLKTVGLYDKTQHEINAVSVFSRLKLQ